MAVTTARRERIPPQSGLALGLNAGDLLVIVDPQGEQVADLACFRRDDLTDGLSAGRTLDYNGTVRLTTGSTLWSRHSRRLMSIVEDRCGVHDILLTPCSAEMFTTPHGHQGYHPSCLDNLVNALDGYGVQERDLNATFNVFMNVALEPDGALTVLAPVSKPGTHTVFRAVVDIVVGVAACSAELANNRAFKPIDIEVIPG